MKTLKTLAVLLIVVGSLSSCATRTTIVHRPARTTVVTKVHNPVVIKHNRTTFYVSKGVWYKKRNGTYVVAKAPAGAFIKVLPRGYKVVKVRGVSYYKYNGVYYKRSGKRYVVVNV